MYNSKTGRQRERVLSYSAVHRIQTFSRLDEAPTRGGPSALLSLPRQCKPPSETPSQTHPHTVFNQTSGHPVAQLNGHLELPIIPGRRAGCNCGQLVPNLLELLWEPE